MTLPNSQLQCKWEDSSRAAGQCKDDLLAANGKLLALKALKTDNEALKKQLKNEQAAHQVFFLSRRHVGHCKHLRGCFQDARGVCGRQVSAAEMRDLTHQLEEARVNVQVLQAQASSKVRSV